MGSVQDRNTRIEECNAAIEKLNARIINLSTDKQAAWAARAKWIEELEKAKAGAS